MNINRISLMFLFLVDLYASTLKNEEKCNEKNLGPWEEPLVKPKIPQAMKNQFNSKQNATSTAAVMKRNFIKILQTVATTTPKEFKARWIKLDTVEASKGKVVGLKHAFSKPKPVLIAANAKLKTLNVKFNVDLEKLRVKFHVKSSKPKLNKDVGWEFRSGSTVSVKINIKTTKGCPIDFGDTEVKSIFDQIGKSSPISVLTNRLKCYIHIILQQAVNFVLQILKGVLEETVCNGR